MTPATATNPSTQNQDSAGAPPSPELFFQTANAYQRTAVLKGAVDLGLFTAIAEDHKTAVDIAKSCKATERGVRILSDALCVMGFLAKKDGAYELTRDSAVFLDRRSPAYMGGTLEFLLSPFLREGFDDVAQLARDGGSKRPHGATLAPNHPIWVTFARAMMPMMAMPADLLAKLVNGESRQPMKVLDIAAGHGLYGLAFAKLNPNARITAVDWANVLEVAKENARAAKATERYETRPGNAFDIDWGAGYDVVLFPNFFHHFDTPTCETLMKKAHAALAAGGRVATLEFVPNDDRISPPVPAMFSLMMLAETPSGDTYTFVEYERMFKNAGFARSEFHPLRPTAQQAIVSYK